VILPILLLAFSPVAHEVAACANIVDVQTKPRRSRAGFSVIVKMHSQDDHGKNTHLCMNDYSLLVRLPGSPSPESHPLTTVDDTWGRLIEFWVEGFTADDNRVITMISDGRGPPLDILVFDRRTNSLQSANIPRAFTRKLSSACERTLHVSGTVSDFVVLATEARGNCVHAQSWRVRPGRVVNGEDQPAILESLSDSAKVVPLDVGTAAEPEPIAH
jgi:hypothetical protein